MRLLAAILAVPLIEIALFVTVGGWLGLGLTLAIVLGTGVFGVLIIRQQGRQAMDDLRQAAQQRRNPARPMAAQALNGLAGVLLILPGFLTDVLGLLLLLPPVQGVILRTLAARVQATAGFGASPRRQGAEVIDGEFHDLTPDAAANDRPPSGWTRH